MSLSFICCSCRSGLMPRLAPKLSSTYQNPIRSSQIRLLSTTAKKFAAQPQPYQKREQGTSSPDKREGTTSDESNLADFSPTRALARQLRKRARASTETYIAYGACERLAKECARHAAYQIPQSKKKSSELPKTADGEDLGEGLGWWYETLGLKPTFNTWAQVTFLHMYLITCRLRMFPPEYAQPWHQHLLDHFFNMAEERMSSQHGIASATTRSRHLKDVFLQWRGLITGYDEGLVKGDAVLATAVWRNLFKADTDIDIQDLACVVAYMRGVLKGLESISDEDVAAGQIVFNDPNTESAAVLPIGKILAENLAESARKAVP